MRLRLSMQGKGSVQISLALRLPILRYRRLQGGIQLECKACGQWLRSLWIVSAA